MQAVILANSAGPSLQTLCGSAPPCMLDMCGRPLIERLISELASYGVDRVVIAIGEGSGEVVDFLGAGRRLGVRVQYSLEDRALGTAGSIRRAAPFLEDEFIVVPAGNRAMIDYRLAFERHAASGSAATLVIAPATSTEPFGVTTTPNGEVSGITGHRGAFLSYTGVCVLNADILGYIPYGPKFDLYGSVFPLLIQNRETIAAFEIARRPRIIDTPLDYLEAHMDLMAPVDLPLASRALTDGVVVSDDVDIHPTAKMIGPVYIGPGARIGKRAIIGPYVSLGDRVRVGEGARVRCSVLMRGARIGAEAEVGRSVVAPGGMAREGARCRGSLVNAIGDPARMVPVHEDDVLPRPVEGVAVSWSAYEATRVLRMSSDDRLEMRGLLYAAETAPVLG